MNQAVNVRGTENVAKSAEEVSAIFVYISTDYVFDGINLGEYKETDLTNPQSEYSRAKLAEHHGYSVSSVKILCLRYRDWLKHI